MKRNLLLLCCLTFCLLSTLAGCGARGDVDHAQNGSSPAASAVSPPETSSASDVSPQASPTPSGTADDETYLWLITIEEKKQGTLFGVYGSDEIPCEYTIELYAVNDGSPSPYEGEFTVAGKIHAYWDVKEDYELADVDYLEFESDHVIQQCTFQLVPNNLAPLTQDPDPLLQGSANAEFLMPTKGDNPTNFSGAAQGYGFGQDMQLDMAATCKIIKTNSEIKLITDVFGSFNGKIERLEAGAIPSEIELAPLVP
ncbi:hypothetical protein HZF24_04720 [Sedimentibacter hydroxybenzoicus DSM 7310]|uniref:Lipoprotein n=1 Tax=Sedimentibacter hydroxybenzoicus DSM 7310 TaxID=1123245 RepID=A0A974BHX2_SEDHY|nr:hypothetical protein [Sedimentibacter hydroxybenzoicus]NYB73437.1 hypothetical protein [Sedimentibacter hydroxybenzoicus DSM 7310]